MNQSAYQWKEIVAFEMEGERMIGFNLDMRPEIQELSARERMILEILNKLNVVEFETVPLELAVRVLSPFLEKLYNEFSRFYISYRSEFYLNKMIMSINDIEVQIKGDGFEILRTPNLEPVGNGMFRMNGGFTMGWSSIYEVLFENSPLSWRCNRGLFQIRNAPPEFGWWPLDKVTSDFPVDIPLQELYERALTNIEKVDENHSPGKELVYFEFFEVVVPKGLEREELAETVVGMILVNRWDEISDMVDEKVWEHERIKLFNKQAASQEQLKFFASLGVSADKLESLDRKEFGRLVRDFYLRKYPDLDLDYLFFPYFTDREDDDPFINCMQYPNRNGLIDLQKEFFQYIGEREDLSIDIPEKFGLSSVQFTHSYSNPEEAFAGFEKAFTISHRLVLTGRCKHTGIVFPIRVIIIQRGTPSKTEKVVVDKNFIMPKMMREIIEDYSGF